MYIGAEEIPRINLIRGVQYTHDSLMNVTLCVQKAIGSELLELERSAQRFNKHQISNQYRPPSIELRLLLNV